MATHRRRLIGTVFAAALAALASLPAFAQPKSIVVASTTSTEQSGLFGHILPTFTKKTGIQVKVVALGTGQALDVGRRGDADVVFVHDRVAEDKFVADGWGIGRRDVMYNDFVLIGPKADPAKVAGTKDVAAALKRIAEAKAPFVSRGDKSGTHAAELRYFKFAGVDPLQGKGSWYRETGSGMGPALNTASSMNAYILADRGTWLAFKNRGELGIVVESPELAKEVLRVIHISKLQSAYRLQFGADGQSLMWATMDDEGEVLLDVEPDTTLFLRVQNLILAPFVPEQQL